VYFFESGKTLRRRHTLRREREVLGGGQLKLSWEERKAFLEEEWGEPVREACLRGVSTRPAGEVLEPVLGESSAAPTVFRIARGRDRAGAAAGGVRRGVAGWGRVKRARPGGQRAAAPGVGSLREHCPGEAAAS